MRVMSGNPGMYQHSIDHSSEGETTQHEPEHGEDAITRVKGKHYSKCPVLYGVSFFLFICLEPSLPFCKHLLVA